MASLVQTNISDNSEATLGEAGLIHHIIGGYTFRLNPVMELIPLAFLRIDTDASVSYNFNIRWKYQDNLWTGMSYSDNFSYFGMVGYTLNNRLNFGYAYGFNSGSSEFNSNSHELVLGVRFLKEGN